MPRDMMHLLGCEEMVEVPIRSGLNPEALSFLAGGLFQAGPVSDQLRLVGGHLFARGHINR